MVFSSFISEEAESWEEAGSCEEEESWEEAESGGGGVRNVALVRRGSSRSIEPSFNCLQEEERVLLQESRHFGLP